MSTMSDDISSSKVKSMMKEHLLVSSNPSTPRANAAMITPENLNVVTPSDCDPLLETMDNCVACVENIDAQLRYNETLDRNLEHGLSHDEAASMKLQFMEDSNAAKTTDISFIPDLNELNICGTDDFEDAKTTLNPSTAHSPAPVKRASSPPTLCCAICLDDVKHFQNTPITFAQLPCCGSYNREITSTTKICTACILLLSSPTTDGSARVGRCPRCREWIVVKEQGLLIEHAKHGGQCQICNQMKDHLVENDQVCDACFLGRRRPLFYECQQCHFSQQIPHPMYRYQPSLETFGKVSWACSTHCHKFTFWRILSNQVNYIPAGDAPECWDQDYWQVARERVMEARRSMAELSRANQESADACVIQ